jgi:membrane protease YdiL (CAAX protease family)
VSGTPLQVEPALGKGRIRGEILLVLVVSQGVSSVYAIVNLIDFSTRKTALSHQSVGLNNSLSDRQVFDFIYQFLGIVFDLVPVVLVCYILWQTTRPHLARLGVDLRRPSWDLGVGAILALVIGAGGIAVYLVARALNLAVNVSADNLPSYWWAIPILLLSALRAALQEEFIVIGYLYARLRELGLRKWTIILSTAAFRGSYHLYQGYGGFIGNVIMGVFFGWLYYRYGRLLPFVVAHFLIDAATFVGYGWAKSAFPALF